MIIAFVQARVGFKYRVLFIYEYYIVSGLKI